MIARAVAAGVPVGYLRQYLKCGVPHFYAGYDYGPFD